MLQVNMTLDQKIRDGKLLYDMNKEAKKYQLYHKAKLINMNILQVKLISYSILPSVNVSVK